MNPTSSASPIAQGVHFFQTAGDNSTTDTGGPSSETAQRVQALVTSGVFAAPTVNEGFFPQRENALPGEEHGNPDRTVESVLAGNLEAFQEASESTRADPKIQELLLRSNPEAYRYFPECESLEVAIRSMKVNPNVYSYLSFKLQQDPIVVPFV